LQKADDGLQMADFRVMINLRSLIVRFMLASLLLGGVVSASSDVTDAARAGDLAAVRELLKSGADVNGAAGDGMTALHWAASRGDAAMTQMLLSAGANIRATTRLGAITALHLASQGGHAGVVAALIAAGAEPNLATTTGATPLMFAARAGSTDTATRLVENGADVNATEKGFGQTALMIAAGLDRADVVKLLLSRGADWKTASAIADLKSLTSVMDDGTGRPQQQQADGGVPGVTRGYRYNELIGTQGGLTALHFAARQGSAAAARALVEGGADVNVLSPGDQASALLTAVINGHFDMAAYFIDRGANPNLASDAGVAPLYAVVNVQWAPIAAYPQPRAHLQQTRTYLDIMKLLLDRGADPNARVRRKVWYSGYNFDQSGVDEAGATAFWRAAYAADVAAMQLLIAHGADPAIPTMKLFSRRGGPEGSAAGGDKSGLPPLPVGGPGATPLHAAAGPGYAMGFAGNSHHVAPGGMLAAVQYLVEELGADVNAVDHDGNSVVHNAAARGDTEMVRYLVSKGADVKKVNRAGQTTIDVANGPVQRTQPYPETIALLAGLGAINNNKCVSC
jgi:uncharacterized protein